MDNDNMEFDDGDNPKIDVFRVYDLAIDNLQGAELLFSQLKSNDYSTILQKLKNCHDHLEVLLETEIQSSLHYDSLFQQKQQINLVFNIIQKQLQDPTKCNKIDLNFCSPFAVDHSSPIKKTKQEHERVTSDSAEIPRVCGLSEIIGLNDIKKVLRSLILLPRTQPQLFQNRRISNTILLYGPPGTGKTRLVHALAAESNADFHSISAGGILSHYVGQTEKTIKSLFDCLKNSVTLSILFIDEVDGFCRKRSESEQEHTRRIKTELMCQISGIEDYSNMFVVCATNCPWDLDTAILRRFQKRIYVPLPNRLERKEFFQYFTKTFLQDDGVDWNPLLQKTKGYSGSDLSNVVQDALNIPLAELEDTKIWKLSNDGFYEPVLGEQDFGDVVCSELSDLPPNSVRARSVQMTDLLSAADNVLCTVPSSDVEKFESFNGN